MKRKIIATCTVGLLSLSLCLPVSAANLSNARTWPHVSISAAVEQPTVYPPDAEGTLRFENLKTQMRESNLSLQSLQATLDLQKGYDRKSAYNHLIDTINELVDQGWEYSQTPATAALGAQMNATADSLRPQLETLEEENYNETLEGITRQLEDAIKQQLSAAETIYLNILALEAGLIDLNRGLVTLADNLRELELRYSLGQVSALTVEQLRATQTSSLLQKKTMEQNLGDLRASFAILVGDPKLAEAELGGVSPNADWTRSLLAKDYEVALAQTKKRSYAFYSAEKAKKDADEAWDDAQRDIVSGTFSYKQAKQTHEAALATYQSTIKSLEQSFQTLYQSVLAARQETRAAETALQYQERSFSAAELKYQQGQIAEKQLNVVRDERAVAQSALDSAKLKEFTVLHKYRAAVEDGVFA